jgi:osmotically-inducible protein OsmY
MRGHLLVLTLALFLSAAAAASWQTSGSSPATGETATPSGAAAEDGSQSTPAFRLAPDGDNQKLREQILNVIQEDSSLASSNLDVDVSDSQIELSGSVPTAHEKEIARRIAQSYGNNRSVRDAKVSVRNAGASQGAQTSRR